MTPFRTTLSTLVAGAALYAGAWIAAPEHTEAATQLMRDRLDGFFAQSCETRPVACLERKAADLKALSREIEATRGAIKTGITVAAEQANTLRVQSQRIDAYLAQGRQALATAAPGGKIVFVNYVYPDRESLEQQLALTFEEGRKVHEQVAAAERLLASLLEAQRKVVTRRTEIEAQIDLMPGKIALARAQAAYAAIETDLAEIDRVLAEGNATQTVVNPLLRTAEELAASETVLPSADAAFQAWLNAARPATR